MGLLTATLADTERPKGRQLPLPGPYKLTVEATSLAEAGGGTQLKRQYGNIRTREGNTDVTAPDGSTFPIGNRKVFGKDWVDHTNPEAARVGHSRITQEAIAAGLMQKPTAENPETELPFVGWPEYAEALNGREVLALLKLGKPYTNKNGEQTQDLEISGWLLP